MLKELLQKPSSLLISLFFHLFALFLLWFFSSGSAPSKPKVAMEVKPLQAVAVDAQQLGQALAQLQQQERQAVEQKRLRQQRELEQRQRTAERKIAEIEQRKAVQRRKAKAKKEAEQQRKAARIKQQVEKKRQVELKRQAALKKKSEAKRKANAEKKRQAELARKKADAEKKRQAKQVRQAKERKEMAASEQRLARQQEAKRAAEAKRQATASVQARRNRLLQQYMRDIQQRVMRNWVPPSGGSVGMSCEVRVVQLSSGTIIDFQVANCHGDTAFRRSVESAMGRLMALPVAPERSLFEREVKFKFKG